MDAESSLSLATIFWQTGFVVKQALFVLIAYWRRHLLQLGIALLGVALGVAVVTAMDIANASALQSFRTSISAVNGKATHQIVAADGFFSGVPDPVFASVFKTPGLVAAAPVVESNGIILSANDAVLGELPSADADYSGGAVVRILGIDPLLDEPFRSSELKSETSGSEKSASNTTTLGSNALNDWVLRDDACVLPDSIARRMHIPLNGTLTLLYSGRRHTLRLIGTFDTSKGLARGSDDLLFMDIAAAQERFGRPGYISSIDLILPPDAAGDQLAAKIQKELPQGLIVQRPSDRAGKTEALLDAFELNLRALSLLALVVGIFLIHNTLTVAVLQRLPLIGTLRCLGSSATEIRRAVLLEALLLGIAGSLSGLLVGTALAGLFLQQVGGIVSDLYVHVGAFSIFYQAEPFIKGLALGVLASLIGAWFPSREAAATQPVQILRRSRLERRTQSSWKLLGILGIAAFAATLGLALVPGSSPVPGLGAAFMLALGGAFCSPAITRGCSVLMTRLLKRRPSSTRGSGPVRTLGELAFSGLSAHLSRTGLAVGALSLALSMTIGVALMVSSFRGTLDKWMEQSLHADLYIRPAGPSAMRLRTFMADGVLDRLRARPEVDAVDSYRGRELVLDDGSPILVVGTDTKITFSRGRKRFPFMAGNPDSAYEGLQHGGVLISESLSRKRHLNLGDTLTLPSADGPTSLNVAGVYYEYATDRGVASMDTSTYEKLFHDVRPNSATVYLKPGVDIEAARQKLRDEIGAASGLYIFSNATLREEAFRVFDRTFAITGQLENLSLAVGLCGIVSALLALLRERSSEFALIRALGLSARGLAGLIVFEGMLLGSVAFLVACALGPALAVVLIMVINVRAFGWTILLSVHPDVFFRVGILTLIMSAFAGVYPALRARRTNVSQALREE
jgi:putative ABC transport system permease protein